MFGVWWCMSVDKGRQGSVILFIEDLMIKCRQEVVVGGLNGQKLTISGH